MEMNAKAFGVPNFIWRRLTIFNLVVAVMLAVVGLSLPTIHAQNVTINTTQNCDNNAVIWCGASSVNQLINKFNNGDGHNSAASIHNIFAFFGISQADINSMNNAGVEVRAGRVTRSGQVFDGQGNMVATNALTGGRQNIAGSTRVMNGGTVFFTRPPSVSFLNSSLSAFVVMRGGHFQFAILASCGNAIKATPTAPAPVPKPKPTPKSAPTPKSTPTPSPTPTPAAPAKSTVNNVCTGNTSNSNTGTASQSGNCSTNTTTVQQTQNTQTNTPTAATTETQTAAPPTQTTSVSSTPAPAAQTTTTTPSTPANLVNTGPGSLIGIFAGVTTLSTLAYRYHIRRYLSSQ